MGQIIPFVAVSGDDRSQRCLQPPGEIELDSSATKVPVLGWYIRLLSGVEAILRLRAVQEGNVKGGSASALLYGLDNSIPPSAGQAGEVRLDNCHSNGQGHTPSLVRLPR
jgi:hypothetical protein